MTKNFKAHSLRTVNSPSQENVTTYFLYVNFRDLPLDLPLEVNPRKPKMTTQVARQLIRAVKEPETDFDINNRGIVVVAKSLAYNTSNRVVELDLGNDVNSYGILDGGHTYTAIVQNRDLLPEETDKFVRLEIIVGAELTTSRISDARNTSAQVSDIALYELDDKFDFIKNAITTEPYANDVAYKDNEDGRLPVIELLKLLFAYNVYKFPDEKTSPVQAYSGKTSVFKNVKEDLDKEGGLQYKNLSSLLPKLVELYETIETTMKERYEEYNPKGHYGKLRGIEYSENEKSKSLYLAKSLKHRPSVGYVMPIFGAFRALIKKTDSGTLEWIADPVEMWTKMGAELVKNTLESSRNNPQDAGKNASIWSNNYSKVQVELFKKIYNLN